MTAADLRDLRAQHRTAAARATSDLEQVTGARTRLAGIAELLGADELAVLELVAHGLARGRAVYGELDVATDRRNFRVEASEELRDSLVYVAAEMLRVQRGRAK